MINSYDNVVFDFGGVIFDIDPGVCLEKLESIGLREAASLLDPYCQKGDFLALEQGEISAAEFFDRLRAGTPSPHPSDKEMEEALCSFIIRLPVRRLKALRYIRSTGKRLFALSNTNPIMYNNVIDKLFRQEGLAINDYFEGIVTSFAEKVCKPNPEIFQILLRRYRLDPSRTVFIDDSITNVRAAENCGIKGFHLPENTDFIEALNLKID